MLFNSFEFIIFFPIVVLIYYLIPQKARTIWIVITSYFFYMCWNAWYALLLFGITLITFLCGLGAGRFGKGKKIIVALPATVVVLALVIFKYWGFLGSNISKVCSIFHFQISFPASSLILPVGISFYTFQALGYVIDVYRGNTAAEKNLIKYAAFISFFPQLVAGPIERSGNLLHQFEEKHVFDYKNVKSNLLLMGWGMFMKIVLADRIAIFVDNAYATYQTLGGCFLIIATILFAFQIYCDFAGYTTIAIGAAGVMGFRLMDNFKSSYCAVSVKDFWDRWHISLTGWFRDYLYIPLGGNRKGKFRKYLNQLIVFLVSGLWHGATWSYVLWGGLNGVFLICDEITLSYRRKLLEKSHISENNLFLRILRVVLTFCIVDFTWLFFRAQGCMTALRMLKSMVTVHNYSIMVNGQLFTMGLDKGNFILLVIGLLILFAVDICHNRGIHFREKIMSFPVPVQWILYIGLIEVLIVFGVWGIGYDDTAFIYFQF